jgi:hypothetical protein
MVPEDRLSLAEGIGESKVTEKKSQPRLPQLTRAGGAGLSNNGWQWAVTGIRSWNKKVAPRGKWRFGQA